jgi:hypothetical protein
MINGKRQRESVCKEIVRRSGGHANEASEAAKGKNE